jgi:hypothetical protein
MARPSKKAAADAQPKQSVAEAAWSNVFPAQEGLSCLALLNAVQCLQGHYASCEPVTTLDGLQFNRVDNENHQVLMERLTDDLAQLRGRLPPLLKAVDVVFDDRTPRLAIKMRESKPLSERGTPPELLRSRFEFDLRDYEPSGLPYRAALKHLRCIVDEVAYLLRAAAIERRELPESWEPATWKIGTEVQESFPAAPIRDCRELLEWLESWLKRVQNPSQWKPAGTYLDDVQRELRNARRAMRAWGVSRPPEFNDNPADIHDAEKQLELLIDGLGMKPSADPSNRNDAGGGRREAVGKQAKLRPCDTKAWSQFRRAMEASPELTTDQAAYDWFIENLADEGERLPTFATWVKYVRLARAVAGEQKNKPGVGHETRSVISSKRLDEPKRTKADRR